ncbi:MAG TPA: hypothetical protein VMM76_23875 [Pirellulaceae bacterium]|nr:hypothetical protein [Pirellulaceae bacterium]
MLHNANPGSHSSDFLKLECELGDYELALQDGVRELLKAYELALDADRNQWDFAVELKVLRRFGLTESNFRWLVCKGIVEQAIEVTAKEDHERRFRPSNNLRFNKRTCFVLTREFAQNIIGKDAMAIALRLGPHACDDVQLVPRWDGDRHELYLVDFLVKRFRWRAKNQETVLTAFGEERWPPEGVYDPLPPHADQDPKQRLRDTIKCLNRNQEHRLIHFRGDGTGERVIWELSPKAIEFLGVDRATTQPA